MPGTTGACVSDVICSSFDTIIQCSTLWMSELPQPPILKICNSAVFFAHYAYFLPISVLFSLNHLPKSMNTVGSTDEAIRPSFLHNVCSTVFLNEGGGGGGYTWRHWKQQ